MAYGLSNGHVTDDVMWPRRCCEAVRSAILATAWLLVVVRNVHESHYATVKLLLELLELFCMWHAVHGVSIMSLIKRWHFLFLSWIPVWVIISSDCSVYLCQWSWLYHGTIL